MPQDQYQEVAVVLVAGTAALLALTGAVAWLFLFYQKKKFRHMEELLDMERRFETELITTQIEVQEQTRKNLAADLHDNIGQLLSLTSVTAASINIDDREKAAQKITEIHNLVNRSIKELRQLSKIIHGEQLIQQGLLPAIEQEVAWMQRTGFYQVSFVHDYNNLESFNPEKDLFLFRLLQESLSNIIKHSGADTIAIELLYAEEKMRLGICDNGSGFDHQAKLVSPGGLGLQNMHKRVRLLQGDILIDSAPGRGTSIKVIVPYP
jgi:signal transduction histidine kinase